ncbi:MAG TPA: putative metal-dependent hydrolase [Terriglobia bacterium]|nr:putative metal-dependent hydrolase [Terriglobia bacterium]
MEAKGTAFDARYPIGKFHWKGELTQADRAELIAQIAKAPARLREAALGLTREQLDTPYRPGGWTARQVIHHVPDSHLNAYVRFKLALTEDQPTIKPYDQERWAELSDTKLTPVETSLTLLESLHERWVNLLRSMTPTDFARSLNHPEHGLIRLDWMLAMYAWHGRHHVGHVKAVTSGNKPVASDEGVSRRTRNDN